MRKEDDYSAKIIACLSKLFDDEGDWSIDKDELAEDDNLTAFFHALSNVAPSYYYERFTGAKVNTLEFNHMANQLVFKYSKLTT